MEWMGLLKCEWCVRVWAWVCVCARARVGGCVCGTACGFGCCMGRKSVCSAFLWPPLGVVLASTNGLERNRAHTQKHTTQHPNLTLEEQEEHGAHLVALAKNDPITARGPTVMVPLLILAAFSLQGSA